jgi:transglutaminase-like putative cysteine protease
VLADGSAEVREQATPALTLAGLLALTTLFVGIVAVVVDFAAVACRQAALAGLGLLVIYCVPVATITGGIGIVAVIGPACAIALLLWADQDRRLADRIGSRARIGGGAAVRIALSAVVAALVLGTVVPTLAEGSLTTGLGAGSVSATGKSLDPTAVLHGQLTLTHPIKLLRLDASVRDPGYLRAVSLDHYDDTRGWLLSNLDGEDSIGSDVRLDPLPQGAPYRTVTGEIQVTGHDDRFLPLLSAPLTVQMDGSSDDSWRYDPASGTVFGRGSTTAGKRYWVAADEPRPTVAALLASAPLADGNPLQQRYTALPPLLDPRIAALVTRLTDGQAGTYARVRAILDYFTSPSNGFVYSLATAPGTGDSYLVDFLRLRKGYCEQYAGAMAVLVREAGIPARVALGYTPGTRQPDGSREITSNDAHAWVEVYFQGLGWVPFDPTPIAQGRQVALPWAPRLGTPAAAATGAGATAAASTSSGAGSTVHHDLSGGGAPVIGAAKKNAGASRPLLIALGAVLLVAALLAVPALLRAAQRRRRLRAGRAAMLWDELMATALDLGRRIEPAWTPRRTAAELSTAPEGSPSLSEPARGAVLQLALGEESASFSRAGDGPVDPALTATLHAARRGLLETVPRSTRLRALLWPSSLLSNVGGGRAGWFPRWRFRRAGRPRTV